MFNLHLSPMLLQQWHFRTSSLTTYWPPHISLSAEMATMVLFKQPGTAYTVFFNGPATFSASRWAPERRQSAPIGSRRRTSRVARQMESHVGAVDPRKSGSLIVNCLISFYLVLFFKNIFLFVKTSSNAHMYKSWGGVM